jgi:UDP-glucose 4-epimerase
MKILVIGANGFLGRNITQQCLQKNWQVDCAIHINDTHIPQNCKKLYIKDLETFDDNYDVIFLVASEIPYNAINETSEALFQTNLILPLKVVEKYRNARIIFSSSVSVLGNQNSIISENSDIKCSNLYAYTKLSGEIAMKFHQSAVCIRYSSIYGKGMNTHTFIPKIIEAAKTTKSVTLWGTGMRAQDYIHVKDAAKLAICAAISKQTGVYLGVSGKSVSNLDIAKDIQRLLPETKINFKGEDYSPSYHYNNSLTTQTFNFQPDYELVKGLKEMIYE